MMNHKKLILCFFIINLFNVPCVRADSSSNVAWEHYIPITSLTILTGVYIYSLLSPCQDLKNQSQCRYWEKDFIDNITVYYPQDYSFSIMNLLYVDDLQIIANETKTPVLVIKESHVKHNPDNIDLLFERAKLLAPCIVYIEKDMTKYTALPFYDFNEFIDVSKGFFELSRARLVKELLKFQENDTPIVILGIAKGYNRESVHDIHTISFNIKYEKPACKERIEFLKLLFAKRLCKNICIDKLAKKTITFSYHELILLAQKAEQYAISNQTYSIGNSDIDKAFSEIVRTHEVYKHATAASFYNTCIHEMGHALMAAIFDEDFLLFNATSTPQSTVHDPKDDISLGLARIASYCNPESQIDRNEKNIMIFLAGKIAEQIFFGLSNNNILNNKTGYADFIFNPGGADSDLQKARNLARETYKICKINQNDPNTLLKELYGETLEILLLYKSVIEQGAKILEQDEFITGSQVYNLLAAF